MGRSQRALILESVPCFFRQGPFFFQGPLPGFNTNPTEKRIFPCFVVVSRMFFQFSFRISTKCGNFLHFFKDIFDWIETAAGCFLSSL